MKKGGLYSRIDSISCLSWNDSVMPSLAFKNRLKNAVRKSSAGIIESAVEKAVSAEDVQKGDAVIKQRLLAQKIVNCILFEEGIQVHFLDAVVEGQVLLLHGVTSSVAGVERSLEIARRMAPGYEVKSSIAVVQDFKAYP